MPKFGFVDVPGGMEGPDFGPIPLENLEGKILAGDIEAAKALNAEKLQRVMKETRQQAVAAIILDIGEEELVQKLMGMYHHRHGEQKWLIELREKGMQELVERLKKVAKF